MEWVENLKIRRNEIVAEMAVIKDVLSVAFSPDQWEKLSRKLKDLEQLDLEMANGLRNMETNIISQFENSRRGLEEVNQETLREQEVATGITLENIDVDALPELPTRSENNDYENLDPSGGPRTVVNKEQPTAMVQEISNQQVALKEVYYQQDLKNTLQNVLDNSSSSMSKSMMNIDKCVPAEGNTLRLSDWTRWKAMLMMSIRSFKNSSEEEKQIFFLRNCGHKLKDVLDEQCNDSLESQLVFQDTMEALDRYFTSDTVVREAKETFKNMVQKEGEENVDFLARLFKFAKNCRFSAENFNENFMDTVARRSSDADIRKEALTFDRGSGERCNYKQLRNFAIHMESSRRIEAERNANKPSTPTINSNQPVFSIEQNQPEIRSDFVKKADRGWIDRRGNDNFRGRSNVGSSRMKIDCNVCGSFYHPTEKCFHSSKSCNVCGEVGHLKIKCRKRSGSSISKPAAKIPKSDIALVEAKPVRNEDN